MKPARVAAAARLCLLWAVIVMVGPAIAAPQLVGVALTCPLVQLTQVLASAAYLQCSSLTGVVLQAQPATGSLNEKAFCGSSACYTFYSQFPSANLAQCLGGYTAGSYSLKQTTQMVACFTVNGVLTPAPATAGPTSTTSPTSPTSPTSAPGVTTKPATQSPSSPTLSPTPGSTTGTAMTKPGTVTVAPSEGGDPASAGSSDTGSPTLASNRTALASNTGSLATGGEAESGVETFLSGSHAGDATVSENDSSSASSRSEDSGRGANGGLDSAQHGSDSGSSTEQAQRIKSSTAAQSTLGPDGSPDGGSDRNGGYSPSIVLVSVGAACGLLAMVFFFLVARKRDVDAAGTGKLGALRGDDDYIATLHSARAERGSISVLGGGSSSDIRSASDVPFWNDEAINAVRIPYEKISCLALVSRGGYGEVYRGLYRDEPVAIKALLPDRRKDMRQIEKFLAEVKLMAALEHDNIVRFVGVAWDSLNELCVVSEFMELGDLRSLLAGYEADGHPRGFNDDKIRIAFHVANALTYMHSLQPMVLHRDLKSRNILLDEQLNAKLTDFGVSRECVDSTMTVGVGSSRWMAPEVMTGGRYDEKADVFSFGVVLSELDTQTLPYAHALEPETGRKLPNAVVVQMMAMEKITVQFTDEDESPLAQIGRRCVALDPAERPSTAEVQHQIHQFWRGQWTN